MTYSVFFHPKAKEEFFNLDGRVRKLVSKQILKIQENPELGLPLGNKFGMDLSGYRKMYVDNKRIRIVYEIINQELRVFLLAIGNREDMDVYEDAAVRKK